MTSLEPEWLEPEQFPFALESIELPSGTLTYVDEGEGPTLLLVHAGMWSFVFRDVIRLLRDDFRCVTMDFPGYGLNPTTAHEYELPELSDLLGEFIDALDLRSATLVMHDLGGPVGIGAAARRPDRVAGLVLANTFAWTPDRTSLRAMFRMMGGRTLTAIDTATNLIPRATSTRFGVGRHLDADGRATFLGPFRERAVRRRFHRAIRSALRHPEFTDEVERAAATVLNQLPALSIFGEKNDPFGFQARLAATFPHHEGVIVEGGNHFPMMDDPDLFAGSIRDWHTRWIVTTPTPEKASTA